jgi:beta-phosphoglucomutase-like phosphatase (HAD superfamily)
MIATSQARTFRRRPPARRDAAPHDETPAADEHGQAPRLLELDTISSRWQLALDADERALGAATESLPGAEVGHRRTHLAQERIEVARALTRLAHVEGVHPRPWLSPIPVDNDMLGLPAEITACVFDLEGVLTDSGVIHAWAWGQVFDHLLQRVSEQAGWHFIPFDREVDYREYLDGRPRLEGIHAFLASRGIRLPEGRFDDPAAADTAYGLARRKGELVTRRLRRRGASARPGVRRYLQASGHAGLRRAVVTASRHASRTLELAGLATLVEARVDGYVIQAEELRTRPAPDLLESACRSLEAEPSETVAFTHNVAGVAAGRAAGLMVIGVAEHGDAELFRALEVDRVVPSLGSMLNRRLVESV